MLAVVNTTVNDYRCRSCGRRTAHRSDGRRWRHRTEADNPLAPYCVGRNEKLTVSVSCLLGDCDRCDGLVIIDNETWSCQHGCHLEAVAS